MSKFLILVVMLLSNQLTNSFAATINNFCTRDSDCRVDYRCQKCWGEHCFKCMKQQSIKWKESTIGNDNLFNVYGLSETDPCSIINVVDFAKKNALDTAMNICRSVSENMIAKLYEEYTILELTKGSCWASIESRSVVKGSFYCKEYNVYFPCDKNGCADW